MNFKIFILICAVIFYEANARGISESQSHVRNKRQSGQVAYPSFNIGNGRPQPTYSIGVLPGLFTGLLNSLTNTLNQFTTATVGAIVNPVVNVADTLSLLQGTIVGNSRPTVIYGPDHLPQIEQQPHQVIVNSQPAPAGQDGQPPRRPF